MRGDVGLLARGGLRAGQEGRRARARGHHGLAEPGGERQPHPGADAHADAEPDAHAGADAQPDPDADPGPPETPEPVQTESEPEPARTTEQAAAYYKNCTEAKAAGAAPLHRGEPGYRSALDRDGDGIACEK